MDYDFKTKKILLIVRFSFRIIRGQLINLQLNKLDIYNL